MVTFFWIAAILGACATICWLEEWHDKRQRRRRVERLRERRRYLDEMEPKRWTT
jgi:hypothetical protein